MLPGLARKETCTYEGDGRKCNVLLTYPERDGRGCLLLMQERDKWNNIKRNFTPGDLFVIMDEKAPRNFRLMVWLNPCLKQMVSGVS